MSYFANYIKSLGDKPIDIYIDMDGVVADYDFQGYNNDGTNDDIYLNKRPVMSAINPLKEVSEFSNVNLYILSVSRYESQVNGKVEWLKKYMDFIDYDHTNILPRDTNEWKKAKELKKEFIEGHIDKEHISIHIDDSHEVLKTLEDLDNGMILLHITSIID